MLKVWFFVGVAFAQCSPLFAQTIQQGGSGNIVGHNNTVTIQNNESALTFPEFVGQIQPFKLSNRSAPEIDLEEKFNSFMLSNEGGIVFLDILPYYTDEDLDRGYDPFNLEAFTITEESTKGGAEYVLRGTGNEDLFFDSRQESRRISGYFKIIGASGPRQGYMSVSLVPLSLQEALLLKK